MNEIEEAMAELPSFSRKTRLWGRERERIELKLQSRIIKTQIANGYREKRSFCEVLGPELGRMYASKSVMTRAMKQIVDCLLYLIGLN